MIGKTLAEIGLGDSAQLTKLVDAEAIAAFVGAVGDFNPLHSDADYAATTAFKEPIAPGIFTAGMISAVIGTQLPGPGAIYASQSLKFVKPVFFGDVITARVDVAEIVPERNRMRLRTVCTNQRGEDVLAGEAWVLPSRTSIVYEDARRPVASAGVLALQPWALAASCLQFWSALGLSLLGLGARRAPSA